MVREHAQGDVGGEAADGAHSSLPVLILSFDVEEHNRIEAASNLVVPHDMKAHYRERLNSATGWILQELERTSRLATFFVVGQLARTHRSMVAAIHQAGHEVAYHGWDHRRVSMMRPEEFREDLRRGRDALEQIIGAAVLGYRAPTFSIVKNTAWALEVLAEEGFIYDSSVYPVHHDRYGVPDAPRAPFLATAGEHLILEIPPVTLRLGRASVPTGGGGYFRLLPLPVIRWGVRQTQSACSPPVAMLYFHPWEFDPEQRRLPLRPLNAFRTYVGIGRSRRRLSALLEDCGESARAIDVARRLLSSQGALTTARIA